jgi:chitosanase
MMLTPSQKAAAQAIVNVFETGSVRGDYGSVTLLPGDTGHLTFGRSQTTLATRNGAGLLGTLIDEYCHTPGARFAQALSRYIARAKQPDLGLDHDTRFKNLLRASADDPVMRDVQDVFFDREYWQRAERAAAGRFLLPLSVAVTYDSVVHGSWSALSRRTDEAAGTLATLGEQRWITAYVEQRRQWLAHHANVLLRKTTYRMETFARLIELGQWNLELPFVVRGLEVSEATLSALPANCYSGPAPGSRSLGLQTPMLRGLDVRLLQLGLSEAGCDVVADGIFGKGSVRALAEHAARQGGSSNGIADAAFVAQMAASVS